MQRGISDVGEERWVVMDGSRSVSQELTGIRRGLQRLPSNSGTPNDKPDFCSIASIFCV